MADTKVGLIFTVGTRDVKFPSDFTSETVKAHFGLETADDCFSFNERTQERAPRPREIGKLLVDHYKAKPEVFGQVTTPIFDRALRYIRAHKQSVEHLVLVATDQTGDIGERFRSNDSCNYAEYIQKKYSENKSKIILITQHVADLDKMYVSWDNLLGKKEFKTLDQYDTIYLCTQGGIDAINTSLLLKSILRWQDKIRHLVVDEKENMAHKSEFTTRFLYEKDLIALEKLLKNYLYAGVADLVFGEPVKLLAEFAEHRLHFDFEGARNALLKADKTIPSRSRYLTQIEEAETNQLTELIPNTYIKFQQKMYVDTLLRLFRINEELLRTGVEKACGIKYIQDKFQSCYLEYWAEHEPELLEFLDNYKLNNKEPLKFRDERNPSTKTNQAILEYYQFKGVEVPELDTYEKLQLEKLNQLRNKSIGAHDFQPVSLELIARRLNIEPDHETVGNTIFEPLARYIGKDLGVLCSDFNELNNEIFSLAQNEIRRKSY